MFSCKLHKNEKVTRTKTNSHTTIVSQNERLNILTLIEKEVYILDDTAKIIRDNTSSMLHISRTFLSILSQEHKGNKTSVSAPVVF